MYTYNHWITNIEQPTTAKAFTYTIWFPLLGQRYIGYKTISGGVKWLTYTSSSRPVKKLISNGHTAVYRIVKWFDNAEDARAEEVSAMTSYDVTNRSEYLNQSIGGVKFGGTISDETRAKLSAAGKGRVFSAETRAKMSASKQNVSAETRAKMSVAKKSKTKSAEHRAKIGEANQIGLYVTPLGTFKSTYDAAIAHNCTPMTISNRCNSTSLQFDNWAFFKY